VRGRVIGVMPVALLCVAMLASLVMLSDAVQNSARFGQLYSLLLVLNLAGLATFVVLILVNLRRLALALRRREPGIRMTVRLLKIFIVLAVVPVSIVYGFSMHFLTSGIDSWFDVRIDKALQDSLELSKRSLDLRMRELLRLTQGMALELAEGSTPNTPLNLDRLRNPESIIVANSLEVGSVDLDTLRQRSGAHEMALITRSGKLIASSSFYGDIVPNLPSEHILLQLRQGRSYIGLDPVRGKDLYIRVAVNVPGSQLGRESRVLQALYPVAGQISDLAENVEMAYAEYTRLAYLRDQLKLSFALSLTLVLLFSVFAAVWAALYSAQRLSAPVRDLALGTEAVAKGDYETTLPVTSRDELGFLVSSFNEMTRRIAKARDEAQHSRDEVESQREYLQAVLERLTSGVLTFDERGRVRTANQAACEILGTEPERLSGGTMAELAGELPYLEPLERALKPLLGRRQGDWQEQVVLFGSSGRQVLMCRGTTLQNLQSGLADYVVVFDDVTALIQAQRKAAWSEAARRLAHEIKNPLTPIQLSAERLRQKYLRRMDAHDRETMDRLTHTIIQQVETMKGMVNTFSDYAKAPKIQPRAVDLNQLAEEVAELFRSMDGAPGIATELDSAAPLIDADPARLRQVLNNLIKNAVEAGREGQPAHVVVTTRFVENEHGRFVQLDVRDSGSGIEPDILAAAFDPYVTSKPRGTGLGLAIVKKIIEEHGGVVTMRNRPEGGAEVSIRLSVENGQAEAGQAPARREVG